MQDSSALVTLEVDQLDLVTLARVRDKFGGDIGRRQGGEQLASLANGNALILFTMENECWQRGTGHDGNWRSLGVSIRLHVRRTAAQKLEKWRVVRCSPAAQQITDSRDDDTAAKAFPAGDRPRSQIPTVARTHHRDPPGVDQVLGGEVIHTRHNLIELNTRRIVQIHPRKRLTSTGTAEGIWHED